MKATVSTKGQITIPEPLRRRFGLRAGTVLEFDEEAPLLTARRVVSREEMARAVGRLGRELAGKSSADWMTEIRGAADLPKR